MNLVFIYGPPAAGKLTIANELSAITGYKVFHNHQTRDIVHDLYPQTLDENYSLVDKLRLDIFKYAARHQTDIIFTYVPDPIDPFVEKVINTMREENGNILFVEANAQKSVLLERVDSESRKLHKKLTDKIILDKLLDADSFASLPYEGIFSIDTGAMSANESAALIAKHFHLLP